MSQEYSQFSPSEMITLYMDGELPDALQPSLFAMLSEQAELRQEMQDHFTVRRHMDTNLIAPPLEFEESIMRRVGAIAVGATLNNPVSTGLATSASAWFGKIVQPLMFVLLGATISGMYFSANNDVPEQDIQVMKQEKSPIQQNIQAPSFTNEGNSRIQKRPSNRSEFAIPNVKSVNSIAIQTQYDETHLTKENTNTIGSDNMHMQDSPQTEPTNLPIAEVKEHTQDDIEKVVLSSINNTETPSPFSLTLRGFTTHSFVDQTSSPTFDPFINNVSMGFQYDVSKEDAVYIEIGQESIVQRYIGTENNYTVQWDQTYHAPWAIVGWQHQFDGGTSLRPLIRVGAGGMETGPMARMLIGAEYDLTRNITLIGGIEGMSTFYAYKGQWFSTQKAGITYGTRISLR
jgi:hypothetical protein